MSRFRSDSIFIPSVRNARLKIRHCHRCLAKIPLPFDRENPAASNQKCATESEIKGEDSICPSRSVTLWHSPERRQNRPGSLLCLCANLTTFTMFITLSRFGAAAGRKSYTVESSALFPTIVCSPSSLDVGHARNGCPTQSFLNIMSTKISFDYV